MKKKHTWANAIPKTRREKDVLRLIKNPAQFNRLTELLDSAGKVSANLSDFEKRSFKTIEEVVAYISCHISQDFTEKDVFLEELNKMVERYEKRILLRESGSKDSSV